MRLHEATAVRVAQLALEVLEGLGEMRQPESVARPERQPDLVVAGLEHVDVAEVERHRRPRGDDGDGLLVERQLARPGLNGAPPGRQVLEPARE